MFFNFLFSIENSIKYSAIDVHFEEFKWKTNSIVLNRSSRSIHVSINVQMMSKIDKMEKLLVSLWYGKLRK